MGCEIWCLLSLVLNTPTVHFGLVYECVNQWIAFMSVTLVLVTLLEMRHFHYYTPLCFSISPSLWRVFISHSNLFVPAHPTGESDGGPASSPVTIVISPASPVSKPPRNQTPQGGQYLLACSEWHSLAQTGTVFSPSCFCTVLLGLCAFYSQQEGHW